MENEVKPKSLFDHLNEIRDKKRTNYYDDLTEQERKAFNQYVILMGLSMDKECISEISFLSKYLNLIPDKQFYKVCCDVIPYGKKFNKWIKNSKDKVNKEVLEKISSYYTIGTSDAKEYYYVMLNCEGGMNEVKNILSKYGLSDKQIKGLMK